MERKVDMVRLSRQEEFYEREAVLGRDVTSVFPKQTFESAMVVAQAETSTSAAGDAMKEALGARKFISESELEAIKKERGGTDEGCVPLKPLAEVLREAKEKKQTEFADKWKQMKQGKNRPLDPEELAFMDKLLDDEAAKEREQRLHEQQEMEEYRLAMQKAREAEAAEPGSRHKVEAHAPKRPDTAALKPVIRPAVKIKPKSAAATGAAPATAATKSLDKDGTAEPASKKLKLCQQPQPASTEHPDDEDAGAGLAGLLGGYGSDDSG